MGFQPVPGATPLALVTAPQHTHGPKCRRIDSATDESQLRNAG